MRSILMSLLIGGLAVSGGYFMEDNVILGISLFLSGIGVLILKWHLDDKDRLNLNQSRGEE